MKPVPTPTTAVDRDLGRLAADRVEKAMMSVMQLAAGPRQAFVISTSAHAAVAGAMAAAYCDMTGKPRDSVDALDVAIGLLQALKSNARGGQ